MSSDPENPEPAAEEPRDVQDVVLDFNFVPTWARQPAAKNPYAQFQGGRDDRDRGPDRNDRRDRRPRAGGDRRGGPDRRDRRDRPGRSYDARREPRPERLPLEISFIPERIQLSSIVRQLHGSCKAYPLHYVAHLLLGKPEFHVVKIEVREVPGFKLYRCSKDGVVSLDPETLRAHVMRKFLGEFYDVQEIQAEPPAGNFVCVGRCRSSGVLLGPPNYHGFNEAVLELHRERFSHIPLAQYRGSIEMVRDPAMIEQWKEQCRKLIVLKPKNAAADAPALKRSEAEAAFWRDHGAQMIAATSRALVPATAIKEIEDERLRGAIHEAWLRESRFPLRMALALRPAFKRMHMHLFKAGGRETFVTAVPPKPIEASRAVETIGNVLRLLEQHPGCTRPQLTEMLCPGQPPDSPAVAEALAPLRWLVEKGHVIEFFDGTLSVPSSGPRPATPRESEKAEPAQEGVTPAATAATTPEPSAHP